MSSSSFFSFIHFNAFHCLVVCLPACATWPKRSGVIIKGREKGERTVGTCGQGKARQHRTGQDRLKLCLLHICVGICIIGSSSLVLVFKDQTSSFHGYHRKCACEKKTWRPFHAACRQSPSFCTQRWSDLLTVSVFLGFFYCWHAMSGHVYVLA